MLRTSSRTWVVCAGAWLLGCVNDPTPGTTNVDSTSESDSTSDSSSESDSSESDSGESETGDPLACMAIDDCAEDEWCDFPDDLCGAGEVGTCTPRPDACGDDPVSVCGCDGMAYVEPCATVEGGVDKNQDAAACTPPPGYFACGDLLCDSSSFYCVVQVSDVGGVPSSYFCTPLPNACGDPVDCTCLAGEACGDLCEPTGAGFTLTCPGG